MQIDRGQYWGMYFLHIQCPRRFSSELLTKIIYAQKNHVRWSGFSILPAKIQTEHRHKATLDIFVMVTNYQCQFVATDVLLYGLQISYIEIERRHPPTDYRRGHEYQLLGGFHEFS